MKNNRHWVRMATLSLRIPQGVEKSFIMKAFGENIMRQQRSQARGEDVQIYSKVETVGCARPSVCGRFARDDSGWVAQVIGLW